MKTYTRDELELILKNHVKWFGGEEGGERANLSYSDLSGSNLSGSNLSYSFIACVSGKNLYQSAGGIGECGRSLTLLAEGKESEWLWWIGCFVGKNTEELLKEVNERHKNNPRAHKTMMLSIEYLLAVARENK